VNSTLEVVGCSTPVVVVVNSTLEEVGCSIPVVVVVSSILEVKHSHKSAGRLVEVVRVHCTEPLVDAEHSRSREEYP